MNYVIFPSYGTFIGILFNSDRSMILEVTESFTKDSCYTQLNILNTAIKNGSRKEKVYNKLDYSKVNSVNIDPTINLGDYDFMWDCLCAHHTSAVYESEDGFDYERLYVSGERELRETEHERFMEVLDDTKENIPVYPTTRRKGRKR